MTTRSGLLLFALLLQGCLRGSWSLGLGPAPGTDGPGADGPVADRPAPAVDTLRVDGLAYDRSGLREASPSPDGGGCKTSNDCADALTCTVDSCVAGGCKHTLSESECLINGQCYPTGAQGASNCQRCDPSLDPSRWMPAPGCVGTLAGDGTAGFADGAAASARFSSPCGIALASEGRVLVNDCDGHRVRLVWKGQVTTLAGDGTLGYLDGPAASARFNGLQRIVAEGTKVYVSELYRIRLIEAGVVSTLAGSSTAGFADGPAAAARFGMPRGLALLGPGELIIADSANARIRKLAAGQVSTIAGNGSKGNQNGPALSASFMEPNGVAIDSAGVVSISDGPGYRLRRLAAGQVSTLAGTGEAGLLDGPAASAKFDWTNGLAASLAGKVFVAEWWNHRIRLVWNGQVSTVAGSGAGFPSDGAFADGPVASARFAHPAAVAVDSQGRIFVADHDNHRIRVIVP